MKDGRLCPSAKGLLSVVRLALGSLTVETEWVGGWEAVSPEVSGT